ncbi:MAG: PIN domain-containing protein [Planctomycetaceae bacterium]|nr:PIN domain-containing protein [Planctomycetaceae bacterium]
MAFLVDTNVLVRYANTADQAHALAVEALLELHRRNETLFIAPQNVVEFWSVATRPVASNGLGMTDVEVAETVELLEIEFPLVAETPEIYAALRRLLKNVQVVGKQIHDARLVAICQANQIGSLLTFNGRHFSRFAVATDFKVVEPASVVDRRP